MKPVHSKNETCSTDTHATDQGIPSSWKVDGDLKEMLAALNVTQQAPMP